MLGLRPYPWIMVFELCVYNPDLNSISSGIGITQENISFYLQI